MAKFSDIIGQDHIKDHLKTAIENGKISHAYIIHGEKNAGKEFIAETFAMALECENNTDIEPCMECHACKQAITKNNPDIITLIHE